MANKKSGGPKKKTVTPAKKRASRAKQAPKSKPQPQQNSLLRAKLTSYYKQILVVGPERLYLFGSAIILLISTVAWAWMGAALQSQNADQLANTYLFNSSADWHNATLPSAHTFLLKWPLFWLIKLLGSSSFVFTLATILVCLITVFSFGWLLQRIVKRPFIAGTLLLALSSVLLMVPAVPYPGGILPVNMAMLATRNLEYIVYLASLVLVIKAGRLRNKRFWLGVAVLAILIASDKLFASLSLGGALICLLYFATRKAWARVTQASNWLVGSLTATITAVALLAIINSSHFTHIASGSGFSPYGAIHGLHNFLVAIVFGVLGLATNLGANPASSATTISSVPHIALHQFIVGGGLVYLLNIVLLILGVIALLRLVVNSSRQSSSVNAETLAIFLLGSSLAAFAVFALTDHFYAVDARYLTIFLFAIFTGLAVWARQLSWSNRRWGKIGTAFLIGLILALPALVHNFHRDKASLTIYQQRNELVAQVLGRHPVDYLVGDYWRVLPTQLHSPSKINVAPLAGCTSPRTILSGSSSANLDKHSFAYLLSLQKGLTDYPACNLPQVIQAYGHPNTSVVISGSQSNPTELLLFYDRGANHNSSNITIRTPSAVLPIPLDKLPFTSCPEGTTIMNIVAHQDDDLLFINPDTINALHANHCVRSVYLTAGDGGSDKFYWLSREQASEAAYSQMLGSNQVWVQRVVQLSSHEYISVAHPPGDYRVALIFMRLPDGNLGGRGFIQTNYESLSRLRDHSLPTIHSIDGQSYYSEGELTSALAALMHTYQPVEIRTQANYVSQQFPDHSDHIQAGLFARDAFADYISQDFEGNADIPIKFYIGYPIHGLPPNVSGPDLAAKEQAFFTYGNIDKKTCASMQACSENTTYGFYLTRQYQNSE